MFEKVYKTAHNAVSALYKEGLSSGLASGSAGRISLTVVLCMVVVLFLADPVMAQERTMDEMLCDIIGQLQGPIGRTIAAIAVIFLGLTLFLGKISWGLALALAIGIAAVFGAETIVNLISGETDTCA